MVLGLAVGDHAFIFCSLRSPSDNGMSHSRASSPACWSPDGVITKGFNFGPPGMLFYEVKKTGYEGACELPV